MLSSLRCFASRNAGFLLIAVSQLFFSGMNAFVALLTFPQFVSSSPFSPAALVPVPTWELIFVRMFITWLCCVSYMLYNDIEDPFLGPKGVRHLLIVRGVSGFWGLFGLYYSIQYLALSDATVLTFLAPVMATILAYLVLGEPYSKLQASAGLACMAGVILIAKPEGIFGKRPPSTSSTSSFRNLLENVTSSQRLTAVLVSLVGMLGAAGAYVSIRKIGNRASALHSISFYALWSTLVALAYAIVTKSPIVIPTSPIFFLMLFFTGIFGFLGQTLLTMGVQRESIAKGMMATYLGIVFALINERILFGTFPDVWSWAGSVIIISGALTVALVRNKKPSDSQADSTSEFSLDDDEEEVEFRLLETYKQFEPEASSR